MITLSHPVDEMVKEPGFVLFDEDYRAHIAKLNAMLARERQEVVRLREQLQDSPFPRK